MSGCDLKLAYKGTSLPFAVTCFLAVSYILISALLNLVPAWNVEQNGIENIRFNLLLRGYSGSKISGLTEEIIDFAELGPFIHQPVKTYSTGMSARLSFAIATAISPEILIVDEVLGAGDGYFANKAALRMKEICDRGKALLFVSHSTSAVRLMCDTAIWLESGSVRLSGPVDIVTTRYDDDMLRSNDECVRLGNVERAEKYSNITNPDEIIGSEFTRLRLRSIESGRGGGNHYIRDIRVLWESSSHEQIMALPLDGSGDSNGSRLDIMGCEWGRVYTRHGVISRMLTPRTGARKGGHLIIKRPDDFASKAWPIRVEWTAISDTCSDLILEFIDLDKATWKPFGVIAKEDKGDGWSSFYATGSLLPVDDKKHQEALMIARERQISPIRISEISICASCGPTNSIRELEPFSVQVNVECSEDAPTFNLSLIIYRSDGVYMFWQPSDFYGPLDTSGATFVTIAFHFDENYFSSGDYYVTVNAMSSLNMRKDIIQSEIEMFDRKTSAAFFAITREFSALQFGALNYRARIEMSKGINGAEVRYA